MSLSQIRNRVNCLQRQFAVALSVVRARRVAEDVCSQWRTAHIEHQPLPDEFEVTGKVREAGISGGNWMGLHRYILECQDQGRQPEPRDFLRSLLPRASSLIQVALRFDPFPEDTNACKPLPYNGAVFPIMT